MWWAWGLKWDIPSNYGNFNDNLLEYAGIEMLQLWPIALNQSMRLMGSGCLQLHPNSSRRSREALSPQ